MSEEEQDVKLRDHAPNAHPIRIYRNDRVEKFNKWVDRVLSYFKFISFRNNHLTQSVTTEREREKIFEKTTSKKKKIEHNSAMEFVLIPILLAYPVSACLGGPGGAGCCQPQAQPACAPSQCSSQAPRSGQYKAAPVSFGRGGYAAAPTITHAPFSAPQPFYAPASPYDASPPPSSYGARVQYKDSTLGNAQSPVLPPENAPVPGRFAEAAEHTALRDGILAPIVDAVGDGNQDAAPQNTATVATSQGISDIPKTNIRHLQN
ncbi:unnamed protein product [Litomosoides sigmodontis]|uniref:Uncharacterized protein n=1 Tax=Litomosoides sigmodontis TaxID=42156 RepID=A0A3P6T7Y3_LITSI|nr:unnamed protein product [Litomosoides sigmodontis]